MKNDEPVVSDIAENTIKDIKIPDNQAPETCYCKTPEQFAEAVGRDFIDHANQVKNQMYFLNL